MRPPWLINDFICKELYAPFILEKDADYLNDLGQKYKLITNQAKKAGADDESLKIIKKYTSKIKEAIRAYYK